MVYPLCFLHLLKNLVQNKKEQVQNKNVQGKIMIRVDYQCIFYFFLKDQGQNKKKQVQNKNVMRKTMTIKVDYQHDSR